MPPFILRLGLFGIAYRLFINRVHQRFRAGLLYETSLPDQVHTVPILQLIKDAIAPYHNEIVPIPLYLEGSDVGIRDDHSLIAIQFIKFSLNVSKSATDGQSAGEYAMWPKHNLAL